MCTLYIYCSILVKPLHLSPCWHSKSQHIFDIWWCPCSMCYLKDSHTHEHKRMWLKLGMTFVSAFSGKTISFFLCTSALERSVYCIVGVWMYFLLNVWLSSESALCMESHQLKNHLLFLLWKKIMRGLLIFLKWTCLSWHTAVSLLMRVVMLCVCFFLFDAIFKKVVTDACNILPSELTCGQTEFIFVLFL